MKIASLIYCFIVPMLYIEDTRLSAGISLLFVSPVLAAVGQLPGEVYQLQSAGEVKILGKQTVVNSLPFVFTISDLIVDFGLLAPEIPATQSTQLTIATGSVDGYQVLAYEDHPLRLVDGDKTIADLTNPNHYGFGFNASGDDVETASSYYRQFPAASLAETAQPVMNQTPAADNPASQTRKATINYMVRIPPSQPSGRYENTVTFIAVPKY